MQNKVVHEGQLTEAFDIANGVIQGSLLSPLLFLLAVDWADVSMSDLSASAGILSGPGALLFFRVLIAFLISPFDGLLQSTD
jgi:hypothetical protein